MLLYRMHTGSIGVKLFKVVFCHFLQIFKLTHKCACPNACVISPSGHSTKGPSTSTVSTPKHPNKDPTDSPGKLP